MPEIEKTNYDILLSAIDELKAKNNSLEERCDKLTKTVDEVVSLNRSLLSRQPQQRSHTVDDEKFRKFMEEI